MLSMRRHYGLILALLCFAAHALLVPALYARPRPPVSTDMQFALPRFAQVLMTAGDRYLAANLAGFRALVAATETMSADNYHILARVQSDVAWLNPAHEDNYYIAAPVLPWNGEVAAAQYILRLATAARPFDWQPPFYYGFNALHFLKNQKDGVEWMQLAAEHAQDVQEQIQLQQMAALWVSKGEDPEFAIRWHRAMAKGTQHKSFARFLEKRADRLENLLTISRAVARYQEVFGSTPTQIQDLVDHAVVPAIPLDPFGLKYVIDSHGKPRVVDPAAVPLPASRKTP